MAVMDQDTGRMLNYRQLRRHPDKEIRKAWTTSAANEFGRLANGVGGRVKGTNTKSKLVPGLWKHDWRPIQFTLVVDDFGVKYIGKEHAQHLFKTIQQHYPVTPEWKGKRYIGITLDWDYKKRQVHLSMPGYVKKALKQFEHLEPTKRQNAPFPHTPTNYGATKQYDKGESTAPALDKTDKRFIPGRQ